KRLLGISHAEANTLSSFCQVHPEPQPQPRTGPEWFAVICRHRNLNLVRRDGGITPTEADGAPISFEGRAAYQFFLRELTERARRVAELRKLELQTLRVDLRLDLDPQLPTTLADQDQIQQVMVNLLNNALHALTETPRPGRLLISTRRKENLIQILVEDNGPGVPPEVLPYIFEPFFTTK